MTDFKNITILCDVIDNFGDIGVAYRLAKSLTELDPALKLTLVCSNLESFASMNPEVDPAKKIQEIKYKNSLWTIIDWNLDEKEVTLLKEKQLPVSDFSFPVILECFQCGRPDWIENIIFSPENTLLHYIFNIEYLTAEQYAEDFHLLKSYTRSSFVKKRFFMPGFTSKTAGLIVDEEFLNSIKQMPAKTPEQFTVTMFSYERDFTQIFEALNRFQKKHQKKNPAFSVNVLGAAGKSLPFVKEAWEKTGRQVKLTELPFLKQDEWDKVLCSSSLNFIRGEESLARAALTGIPFVWHAYLQDEDYQLVKVDALLDRLLPYLLPELRDSVKILWDDYNTPGKELDYRLLDKLFDSVYDGTISKGFKAFADALLANGSLAKNLLDYLHTIEKNP